MTESRFKHYPIRCHLQFQKTATGWLCRISDFFGIVRATARGKIKREVREKAEKKKRKILKKEQKNRDRSRKSLTGRPWITLRILPPRRNKKLDESGLGNFTRLCYA